MPSALSETMPPAPRPQQGGGSALMGGMMTPQAQMPAGGAPGGPGGGQQQAPAPDHAQTVAILRHTSAIAHELVSLLKNPGTGKADMKSSVIDGVTTLVSRGMMTAPDAVQQLGTFPEKPFEQRQWLEQHLMSTMQAQMAVLSHHQTAFGGTAPDESTLQAAHPDNHRNAMSSVMSQHYGRK